MIVDLEIVEQELRSKKEASRRKEEDEVIEQIKVNPKVFYSYARRKTVIRAKIGPLLVIGQTSVGKRRWQTSLVPSMRESVPLLGRISAVIVSWRNF